MTQPATKTAISDTATETTYLAATGQQMAIDTLCVELGALKAMLPLLSATQANAASAHANRLAKDAELEAMFDNMPV